MTNKKMLGVSLFVFLLVLFGVIYITSASFGLIVFEGKLNAIQRIFLAALGISLIIIAIGIAKFRNWARIVLILLSVYYLGHFVIKDIIPLVSRKEKDVVAYLYSLFVFLVFLSPIIYFTRFRVKECFRKNKKTD